MTPVSAYQYSPIRADALPPSTHAKPTTSAVSFDQVLAYASGISTMSTDDVVSEMKNLGAAVTVKAVPNNPVALRSHAQALGGTGNVTIAPNILADMANDTAVRQKYLDKISSWLSRRADHEAMVGAFGGRSVYSSMVIHEDGTVTYNSMTVCDPEDESEEVFRSTQGGVTTIIYSCGKIRFESAGDVFPELPGDYNHSIPVASWDNTLQDNKLSVDNYGIVASAYLRNLRTASNE